MRRALLIGFVAAALGVGSAGADVVVQRWGVSGHVQRPDTLTYEPVKDGTMMTFDLSALPRRAKVYRARLKFFRGGGYARVFRLFADGAGGRKIELIPPYYRWFDATGAVRGWLASGARKGRVFIRSAPQFARDKTFLEIAYEGRLGQKPRQVSQVRAFYRAGQVFITFREIEDLSEGHDDYPWGHLIKKSGGYKPEMLKPKDDRREVRYRVYRHDRPITAGSIGQARLLADVVGGSRFNTRQVRRIWRGEQVPSTLDEKFAAVRLAVEPGKPLPSGVGKYVHSVEADGTGHYAVVAAVNGVENTTDVSEANAAGPIAEKVAPPEPVAYKQVVTDLKRSKDKYVQLWCNYYVGPPLSRIPMCYDVVVGYCRQQRAKPAPVHVNRGHSWIVTPEPVGPGDTGRIDLTHCCDDPNAFWMGVNDAYDTLKGIEEGRWQPFPQRRQEALLRWLDRTYGVDWNRISVNFGAWGMMEFEKPQIYAYVRGWGLPEVTKGFQAWQRAKGVWGGTGPYAGRAQRDNPFWRQDYTRYVLENPAKETPFFNIHMGWGAHFSEMGWPCWPRFLRAMIDTKRPFVYMWKVRGGRPSFRRDRSVPAFGNCSLDDNPGNGDANNGETFQHSQINGYLTWDSETVVDEPGRWEMTVRLDASAPLPKCTVDLTPRRCQKFKAQPGQQFRWTCTAPPAGKAGAKDRTPAPAPVGRLLGSGTAGADKWGLVTIRRLPLVKGDQRVRIVRG